MSDFENVNMKTLDLNNDGDEFNEVIDLSEQVRDYFISFFC